MAQWGKLIQATCRNDDITGYWDNGDFLIGMPNLDKTQAKEHLSELLTILRKQVFTAPENVEVVEQVQKTQPERFQVAFNCAVAEFSKDGTTLHSLYQTCIQS